MLHQLPLPPSMDSSLAAHLQVELRLLQDHASLLAYLLCSNQDRQASITATLTSLDSIVLNELSPAPLVASDFPQPVGSGDIDPCTFQILSISLPAFGLLWQKGRFW